MYLYQLLLTNQNIFTKQDNWNQVNITLQKKNMNNYPKLYKVSKNNSLESN